MNVPITKISHMNNLPKTPSSSTLDFIIKNTSTYYFLEHCSMASIISTTSRIATKSSVTDKLKLLNEDKDSTKPFSPYSYLLYHAYSPIPFRSNVGRSVSFKKPAENFLSKKTYKSEMKTKRLRPLIPKSTTVQTLTRHLHLVALLWYLQVLKLDVHPSKHPNLYFNAKNTPDNLATYLETSHCCSKIRPYIDKIQAHQDGFL